MPKYGVIYKYSTKKPIYCYRLADNPQSTMSFHIMIEMNDVQEVAQFLGGADKIEIIRQITDHVYTENSIEFEDFFENPRSKINIKRTEILRAQEDLCNNTTTQSSDQIIKLNLKQNQRKRRSRNNNKRNYKH